MQIEKVFVASGEAEVQKILFSVGQGMEMILGPDRPNWITLGFEDEYTLCAWAQTYKKHFGELPAEPIPSTAENWESRKLGCDERYAVLASEEGD